MRYFSLFPSLNSKIVGQVPQVKFWSETSFTSGLPRINDFDFCKLRADYQPSPVLLWPKAKVTDFISLSGVGCTSNLLISSELLNVTKDLEPICQIFTISVTHKEKAYDNFWLIHPIHVENSLIDYQRSSIEQINLVSVKIGIPFAVFDEHDFERKRGMVREVDGNQDLVITRVVIREDVNKDFFVLTGVDGGSYFVVSEDFKQLIEASKCTGLAFKPLWLSLNEYLSPGSSITQTNVEGR